ncbi:MAG: hypothetical protein JWP38_3140 [Herbaspirillum sp.]|jgi:hypothetical protein|nr:hypothetical protein [Herbaspirillum sp.]
MFDFSKWADAYISGAFAGFDRQVVKKGMLRFFKRIAVESDPHKRISRDIFVAIDDDLLKMLAAISQPEQFRIGRAASRYVLLRIRGLDLGSSEDAPIRIDIGVGEISPER